MSSMGSDARVRLQVVAEHGPAISATSLKAMTYLDMVMKESQRRYPIVGGVFRKALRDFDLPGGLYVPKVSHVGVSLVWGAFDPAQPRSRSCHILSS